VLPAALCRYAFPIKCTNVVFADDNETVREIHAEYDPEKKSKPKVFSLAISVISANLWLFLTFTLLFCAGGSTLGR